MKRLLLVFASLLIGLTTASATEFNNQKAADKIDINKKYRYAQPIIFMERGIEFLIFPDGSFDFNTHASDLNYNDNFYRNNNSRRGTVNATYRGPNVNVQFSSNIVNRGVSISRDRNGTIRRIGYVYLNYDRYGKITCVGSVFINYGRGRHATLTQVGGLRVNYNHWGEIVNTRGYVNSNNRISNYEIVCGNNDRNNHYDNDDNYYYYKQNGEVKKEQKIIFITYLV